MDNNIKESNLERFQNLVYSDDLDIVCVNETWLSGHVYNAEILHSGYCTVRKDRKMRGGVVLLGIKTTVFKSVRKIEHNHDLEIAMAEISCFSTNQPLPTRFCSTKVKRTQLIEVFEQIGRKLDNSKQIDVINLDMSKAFDKVSHTQLMHRLHKFGF